MRYLFLLLTFCQPLLYQKPYEIEWDVQGPHTLFQHKFLEEFEKQKRLISSDRPTKITLIIKTPTNNPLIYSSQNSAHVNVARWHMKYEIHYTLEKFGENIKKGVLKTHYSYYDKDDYGNIFMAEKGYDKLISQMLQEIILILNA